MLLTTHYMEEAQRLCDRVAIIARGKVIALGTPLELIASLEADQIVEFDAEREPQLDRLRALDGVQKVDCDGGSVRLTVRHAHDTVPALLAELEHQQIRLKRLATHHATLEDVFMTLTGRHLRDD